MKIYFIFCLYLFFLTIINGYILRSEELGRKCKINFKKKVNYLLK